ncbi:MAG: class I SAM-dependent methyltransferase [Cyanobacteria bacterium P01_D01_bin.156]
MSHDAMVSSFAHHFEVGKGFSSIQDARDHAAVILGTLVQPGTAQAKLVDEAIENGVIRAARTLVQQAPTPEVAYQSLVDLYNRHPPLKVRSSTSVQLKAYSTPIPIAYLASVLAGISPKTTVYEPTAGNGALLIEATPEHATVNELDAERAAALRTQGFRVTENDALNFVPDKKHDAIIMNPPFAGYAKNEGGYKQFDTGYYQSSFCDHAIALQALRSLKPDGKAVLILCGQPENQVHRYNWSHSKKFYQTLYQQYNVTDHVTVAGKLYEKQGAAYPMDIIVIQGTGPSARPLPGEQYPRRYNSFEELGALLQWKLREQGVATTMPLNSVKDALAALEQGSAVHSADHVLTIASRDEGNTYVLKTPLQVSIGGAYYLDEELLKAAGSPFFSAKGHMENVIPAEKLEATLAVLMKKGTPLIAVEASHVGEESLTQATTSLKEQSDWYRIVQDIPLNDDLSSYAAINTARHLLEISGIQADMQGRRLLEGSLYRIEEFPKGLSIQSKNGGEIIRLEEGKLTSDLSNEDIARFSIISERLSELVQQREGLTKLVTSGRSNNHNSNAQTKL